MNLLGCLQTTPPSGDASVLGQGVFGAAVAFLLVTLIVVALATPLIRRAFRRHVVRLMGLDSVAQRPEAWWKLRGKENRVEIRNQSFFQTSLIFFRLALNDSILASHRIGSDYTGVYPSH